MCRYTRPTAIGCVATLVLLIAAGVAPANRGIIPTGGAITAVNEGTITFGTMGGFTYRCARVTLVGEVWEVFDKSGTLPASQVGQIDTGTAGECRAEGGAAATVVFLMERRAPADMRYNSFLGTLPRISGLLILFLTFRFSISTNIIRCLFQGDLGVLALFPPSVEGGGTQYTRVSPLLTRLRSTDCMGDATVSGTFRLTPAQSLLLV
ncbi:MAG: hypothetical protein WBC33_09335 [Conexibacter sp.]